jgi:hypothetical protein
MPYSVVLPCLTTRHVKVMTGQAQVIVRPAGLPPVAASRMMAACSRRHAPPAVSCRRVCSELMRSTRLLVLAVSAG